MSETYPSLEDIALLAKEHKSEEVILGLAKRWDAKVTADYERALGSFEHFTEKPKSSLGEAEISGRVRAGESPDCPEALLEALLKLAES